MIFVAWAYQSPKPPEIEKIKNTSEPKEQGGGCCLGCIARSCEVGMDNHVYVLYMHIYTYMYVYINITYMGIPYIHLMNNPSVWVWDNNRQVE